MKFIVVALLTGSWALALPDFSLSKTTDTKFLEKQKNILRLFKHVNQPSYYKDHIEISKTYHIHEHFESYIKPEVAEHYSEIYKYGLLPKSEIFSVFYEEHLQQAIALYELFYYAKDYETFYKTAVWARQHVNEGVYLYALSVAIVHRSDTTGIVLPPIYEIYPYYFFNNEVIQQAYKYKQQYYSQHVQQDDKHLVYTINANYSGYYLNLHPEQSLSYFTEDIGLNSFYYYYHIHHPHWLASDGYQYHRGEFYYYLHQQILARYYLERLSNGFGEIPFFNWEAPFKSGYYPSLEYPNGLQFSVRPNNVHLYEYFYNYGQKYGNNKYTYSYTLVQDYERRIRDAIDRGYIFSRYGDKIDLYFGTGINILGNLVESNPNSLHRHLYGPIHVYARHVLGYSYQPLDKHHIVPSALEHYETSLRDPAFYQLYKRILLNFLKFNAYLPSYTENYLRFEGVQVKKVEFDRLVTYFDYFYTDISNAVYVTPQEYENDKVEIRVRQQRLNHKPFTYKIYINSEEAQMAYFRIYLGPKYDEYGRYINISQNHLNFVKLEYFKHYLKSGENIIERSSNDVYFHQNDRTSFKQFYQQVLGALNGTVEFEVPFLEADWGPPKRFFLPKGTSDGFECQFYILISPHRPPGTQETVADEHPLAGSRDQSEDTFSMGYPFDRPIHYDQIFHNIPNFYVHSAKIFHSDAEEIDASTSTQH